jgi:hypothetical protein
MMIDDDSDRFRKKEQETKERKLFDAIRPLYIDPCKDSAVQNLVQLEPSTTTTFFWPHHKVSRDLGSFLSLNELGLLHKLLKIKCLTCSDLHRG